MTVASLAAMRKATEVHRGAKPPAKTPQYFSRIKYEQQVKLDEQKKVVSRQQLEIQRQVFLLKHNVH